MENAQFTKKDTLGNSHKLIITEDKVILSNQHGIRLSLYNITHSRQKAQEMRDALVFVMNQEGDEEDLIEALRKEIIAYTEDRDWKFGHFY